MHEKFIAKLKVWETLNSTFEFRICGDVCDVRACVRSLCIWGRVCGPDTLADFNGFSLVGRQSSENQFATLSRAGHKLETAEAKPEPQNKHIKYSPMAQLLGKSYSKVHRMASINPLTELWMNKFLLSLQKKKFFFGFVLCMSPSMRRMVDMQWVKKQFKFHRNQFWHRIMDAGERKPKIPIVYCHFFFLVVVEQGANIFIVANLDVCCEIAIEFSTWCWYCVASNWMRQ